MTMAAPPKALRMIRDATREAKGGYLQDPVRNRTLGLEFVGRPDIVNGGIRTNGAG
jgi:hypothetical protein